VHAMTIVNGIMLETCSDSEGRQLQKIEKREKRKRKKEKIKKIKN
jgi:hypothetical protein